MGFFKKILAGAAAGAIVGGKTGSKAASFAAGAATGSILTHREFIKKEIARNREIQNLIADAEHMTDDDLREAVFKNLHIGNGFNAFPYADEYTLRYPEEMFGYYAIAAALKRSAMEDPSAREEAIAAAQLAVHHSKGFPDLMLAASILGLLLFHDGKYQEAVENYGVAYDLYSKGYGDVNQDSMMTGFILSLRKVGYSTGVSRFDAIDYLNDYIKKNPDHARTIDILLDELARDVSERDSVFEA